MPPRRGWNTPPTYHRGTVLFGSADGYVYCLRAQDGALAWRFRAAPEDRRIGAFGQLESAWPVHGGILVQQGLAYFAAGRSSHLDGGIWVYALDPVTGEVVYETHLEGPKTDFDSFVDNINPAQGALTDVLQGDGNHVYLRHLMFSSDLRQQTGDPDRLRPLGGLLDDSYFKRAYWRYGRGATYGALLAHDERSLYILRMFDSLQCLDPANFFSPGTKGYLVAAQPRQVYSHLTFANSSSLNPLGKSLTVEAWVKADAPEGAIVARGGLNHGYALVIREGRPEFTIRVSDIPYAARAQTSILGRWAHLAGTLTPENKLEVWIDGQLAARAEVPSPLVANPGQDIQIGADAGTGVGEYESPFAFTGVIDEVQIYHRALSEAEIAEHFAKPGAFSGPEPDLVLCLSFDQGTAKDESGNGNDGVAMAVERVEGKSGTALRFAACPGSEWSIRIPLRGRAMVVAKAPEGGRMLIVAGTPDVVDPDDPFAAFEGRKGGPVRIFAADSGNPIAEYEVGSPPVFNGMAAAGGRLYIATVDGRLVCLG
ncbi:MAG: LamG-like jellyroll fold domain-containing protein [Candidatus Zipacnadales bacterium]